MDGDRTRSFSTLIFQAGIIAGLAFLAAVTYSYYLTRVAFAARVRRHFAHLSVEQLLQADVILMAVVVVISSLVGSLLAKRYGLAGLGSIKQLRRGLPFVVVGGAVLSAATYLLFGRTLAHRVSGYYPTSLCWSLLIPLKAALFDETVARFGMMTIFCGAVRRVWLANLLQAVFFTSLTSSYMAFYSITLGWNFFTVASLCSSLVVHLVLGITYARFGLLGCALQHFIISLKFVFHAV